MDEFVISLSAKGLTPGEAQAHLAEVYSAQVSRQTISTITDKVMEGMAVWQKPAAGLGLSGEAGEGVKHWLHVLAELKNRGVIDALMVVWCGLPETIEHVAPQTPGNAVVIGGADAQSVHRAPPDARHCSAHRTTASNFRPALISTTPTIGSTFRRSGSHAEPGRSM